MKYIINLNLDGQKAQLTTTNDKPAIVDKIELLKCLSDYQTSTAHAHGILTSYEMKVLNYDDVVIEEQLDLIHKEREQLAQSLKQQKRMLHDLFFSMLDPSFDERENNEITNTEDPKGDRSNEEPDLPDFDRSDGLALENSDDDEAALW